MTHYSSPDPEGRRREITHENHSIGLTDSGFGK